MIYANTPQDRSFGQTADREAGLVGTTTAGKIADYIWLNGELVPYEQATVHLLTPTLHYGPGVFEGIRCYMTPRGPAIFRLREHLERFLGSIHVLGVPEDLLSHTLDELRIATHRTVQANRFSDCYIRPIMFMHGPLDLDLDQYQPVIAIAAWPWGPLLGKEKAETGVRMMVSSFARLHVSANMIRAKITGQYVNAVLAKTLASRAGFDEAIMLDPEGYVAECTGENLFLVRGDVLYTTPRAPLLEGITRQTIITLAAEAGFRVVEQPLTREQLYVADEAFACGTAAEVVAIREIDYRTIGLGEMGPVTAHLQQLYLDTVHGRTRHAAEWLEFVMMEPLY